MVYNKCYTKSDTNIHYKVDIVDCPFDMYASLKVRVNCDYRVCFVDWKQENYKNVIEKFGYPHEVIKWHHTVGKQVAGSKINTIDTAIFIYSYVGKLPNSNHGEYNSVLKPQNKGNKNVRNSDEERDRTGVKEKTVKRFYFPHKKKQLTSIITDNRSVGKGGSSFEKSEYIPAIILDWLCKPGDKVHDGFAGEYGTFGKICKRLGLDYTGYELYKRKVCSSNRIIENLIVESPRIELLKITQRYNERFIRIQESQISRIKDAQLIIEKDLEKERNGENHLNYIKSEEYKDVVRVFMYAEIAKKKNNEDDIKELFKTLNRNNFQELVEEYNG